MREMDGFDADASIDVGKIEQALGDVTAQFTWAQGDEVVDLGSANSLFCYLTHIQGHFQGGGEVVRVYVENGRWKLGGHSDQTGVLGRARCTPVNFQGRSLIVTPEKKWTQSQGAGKTRLATDDGFTACVLTRVEGHFEGAGEVVEITRSNGEWLLGGSSRQAGVAAGARCVSNVFIGPGTPTYSTECISERCNPFGLPIHCAPSACFSRNGPTHLAPLVAPAAIWGPNVFTACGLGKMSGKFKGGAEYVKVYLSEDTWKLHASGKQDSVYSTSAYCFL